MTRRRIVFMGSPESAIPTLDRLADRHQVVAVYTQPPRRAGRGMHETLQPVAAHAAARGLAVCHPESLKTAEDAAALAAWRNPGQVYCRGLYTAAAVQAALPGKIAMKFDDVAASRCVMKTVDILRDKARQKTGLFQLGQGSMSRVRGRPRDHVFKLRQHAPDLHRIASKGSDVSELLGRETGP